MEERIKQKILEDLTPEHLEVINESHMHAGHAGDDGSGQTHFKLIVVSNSFDGCNRVQRSRMVFKALDGFFEGGLHALQTELLTPSEHVKK